MQVPHSFSWTHDTEGFWETQNFTQMNLKLAPTRPLRQAGVCFVQMYKLVGVGTTDKRMPANKGQVKEWKPDAQIIKKGAKM